MAPRVLVIEDEQKIARILLLELTHEGYSAEWAETGREGLERAIAEQWDLILLDIMLPELNGIEVLRRIRNAHINTPVILLTARDATPDKVSGLDQGANDYITKPFEIEELLARIRVCLRSQNLEADKAEGEEGVADILSLDDLTVDIKKREVSQNGTSLDLTPKEFELLVFLMENRDKVVSREEIIQHVWGYDFMGDTNVVDVYIRYLRKKIDAHSQKSFIQTVRGVGYRMKESLP